MARVPQARRDRGAGAGRAGRAALVFAGGIVAVFVGAAVCTGLYALAGLLGKKSLLAVGTLGLAVGASVFIYGKDQLERELESITEAESIDSLLSARKDLWEADVRAARDFLFLGTGIGSHREVYPTYMQKDYHVSFSHAESSYVQLLLEAGHLGLSLVVAGIALCGWWCIQAFRNADSTAGLALVPPIAGGLSASVVHSLTDFVWHIPACMSLAVILAACLCRLRQLAAAKPQSRKHERVVPRIAWVCAAWRSVASAPSWFAIGLDRRKRRRIGTATR